MCKTLSEHARIGPHACAGSFEGALTLLLWMQATNLCFPRDCSAVGVLQGKMPEGFFQVCVLQTPLTKSKHLLHAVQGG